MTDKSFSTYRQKLNGYILPAIGCMKMKDVREPHLQRILNDKRGRSFFHVSKLRMMIQAMFARAYSARIINRDPAANLVLPRTTKGTHRSLTEKERAAILTVAERGKHNANLFTLIMLYCGLRPGEAVALQWKDMDFDNAILHVTKAKESGKNDIKGRKTEAGNTDMLVTGALLETLGKHKRGPFQQVLHQAKNADKPHTQNSMATMWNRLSALLILRWEPKCIAIKSSCTVSRLICMNRSSHTAFGILTAPTYRMQASRSTLQNI